MANQIYNEKTFPITNAYERPYVLAAQNANVAQTNINTTNSPQQAANCQETQKRDSGDTQETPKRHTKDTQETHKRHTKETQETPKRHTKDTKKRHTQDTQKTHKRHTRDHKRHTRSPAGRPARGVPGRAGRAVAGSPAVRAERPGFASSFGQGLDFL